MSIVDPYAVTWHDEWALQIAGVGYGETMLVYPDPVLMLCEGEPGTVSTDERLADLTLTEATILERLLGDDRYTAGVLMLVGGMRAVRAGLP